MPTPSLQGGAPPLRNVGDAAGGAGFRIQKDRSGVSDAVPGARSHGAAELHRLGAARWRRGLGVDPDAERRTPDRRAEERAAAEKVQVHTEYMGGGFGRRGGVDYIGEAVEVAKSVDAQFLQSKFRSMPRRHMPRVATTLHDYGAEEGKLASHRWLAGNTAVPFFYGFDEQLEKTIEFLKSGRFLNVDIFALKKADQDKLIAPLGAVPFELKPNDVVEAYVVIQNKNIGHSLIPEVRDLYEAWVEVVVAETPTEMTFITVVS